MPQFYYILILSRLTLQICTIIESYNSEKQAQSNFAKWGALVNMPGKQGH